MKHVMSVFILSFVMAATVVGCANRWREANYGIDPSEIHAIMNLLENPGADSGITQRCGRMDEALAMYKNTGNMVYIAESLDAAEVRTITPFNDTRFLSSNCRVNPDEIIKTRAIYIHELTEVGFHGAWLFEIHKAPAQKGGAPQVFVEAFVNNESDQLVPGHMDEGAFYINLSNNSGSTVTLFSDDLTEDEEDLAMNVQMSVLFDGFRVGKLSTLEGFAP